MKKKLICIMMLLAGLSALCMPLNANAAKKSDKTTFRFAGSQALASLDYAKGNSISDMDVQYAVTESLVRLKDGKVVPGLAKSWKISADGLTYTFTLRKGLKWSNGSKLKAADVVYGFQRAADPKTQAPFGWIFEMSNIRNADKVLSGEAAVSSLGVSASGSNKVIIKLSKKTPYFLTLLGGNPIFSPAKKSFVKKAGNKYGSKPSKTLFSGPFMITKKSSKKISFKKNPYYWNKSAVIFKKAEYHVIENGNTLVKKYNSKKLDYASLPYDKGSVKGAKKRQNGSVDFLYINNQCSAQPLLKNASFRLALNYAIDRKAYVSKIGAYYDAAGSVVPTSMEVNGSKYGKKYGSSISSFPLKSDAAKAKSYLEKALKDNGINNASSVEITITASDNDTEKMIAETIAAMWRKNLGIKVSINYVTYSEKYGVILPGHEYEIAYGGWAPDFQDPVTYLELFRKDSPNNYSVYSNNEFEKLLADAANAKDAAKRMKKLAQAENQLLKTGGTIPLQFRKQAYMLNSKVKGIDFQLGAVSFNWAFAKKK